MWVVCGVLAGCRCGCVVGLGCLGGRWWVDGGSDWLVGLAVWGRWRGRVVWVGVGAVVWWAGMRVCWRRGFSGGGCVGCVGGGLAGVWVGRRGWVRKQSRVVWWLVGGVGRSGLPWFRLGCVVGIGW